MKAGHLFRKTPFFGVWSEFAAGHVLVGEARTANDCMNGMPATDTSRCTIHADTISVLPMPFAVN